MARNPTPRGRRLAATAAVVLSTLALGACSGSGGDGGSNDGNAVAVEDFAFSPEALRVKAGTTVTFTNRDAFDHTVTAKDQSFDSGHLAKDATFERTFDAPGTYAYRCAIHNSMTGSVVVA